MNIVDTDLPDVKIIEPSVFTDRRGFFFESFNLARFEDAMGFAPRFVQSNHSRSARGVIRGLHYQVGSHAQAKLIRVVQGAAYDVAVDLRADSPTFGRWTGTLLSAENRRQLWIPEGFAHGFMALVDDTDVLYDATQYWAPGAERVIAWNDPLLAIAWPEAPERIVSDKDAAAGPFSLAETL